MSTYQAVADSTDRDAWLRARQSGVTATDVSRLANGGKSVWATIRAEKAGHTTFHGNAYTAWGVEREPVIAAWADHAMNLEHNVTLLQSTENPLWLATPDLISADDSEVGDIKTAKAPTDGVPWVPPQKYEDQVQWQMLVTGAETGYLIVELHEDFRVVDFEPLVFIIPRKPDRITELIGIAEQFMKMGEPSELDFYLADWSAAKEAEDAAKRQREEAETMIRKSIGNVGSFKHVSDFGSITLSTPNPSKRVDSKKLKETYPDLYEEVCVESQGKPRLTIRAEAA